MIPKFNQLVSTGNALGLVATTKILGPTLNLARVARGTLTAQISVTAATATLTFTPSWQVANKADFTDGQVIENDPLGSAHPVLATGTAAIVTKALQAPRGVHGFRYCRAVLTVGVVTGQVGDLYSIGYTYAQEASLSN